MVVREIPSGGTGVQVVSRLMARVGDGAGMRRQGSLDLEDRPLMTGELARLSIRLARWDGQALGGDSVSRGQAFGQAPVGSMRCVGKERHEMNGAGMEAHEVAEIGARLVEMEDKLDRLEELARRLVERLAATSSSASR
ncbi:hypothetical protein [Streptomyces sp. CC228A]|uniref:hypothetical protein n=1 Tax=Streptomyces sp. CC228A TaxID=2898186 RepID=UPI001F2B737C|nr:hypothetical protein [Streptomyces sp. CC228A]